MKRAHQIRKEAAKKFNCKTSEIIFSLCLKIAWAEIKENKTMNGTEKQIKWAEDIKAGMDFDSAKTAFAGNKPALKALAFIENIDSAKWWIKEGRTIGDAQIALACLAREGLTLDNGKIAIVDQNTGSVTVR